MDPATKEACGLHGDAMKKILKTLAVVALVVVVLAVTALTAAYFTFCGGHPHGIC